MFFEKNKLFKASAKSAKDSQGIVIQLHGSEYIYNMYLDEFHQISSTFVTGYCPRSVV